MQLLSMLRLLGMMLMLFSLTLLPPAGVSLFYGDGQVIVFLDAIIVVLLTGLVCALPAWRHKRDLRTRDGFLIVVMFWVVLGLAGALPLALSTEPVMSVTDAVFESMSGLTTTGATVLTGLYHLAGHHADPHHPATARTSHRPLAALGYRRRQRPDQLCPTPDGRQRALSLFGQRRSV